MKMVTLRRSLCLLALFAVSATALTGCTAASGDDAEVVAALLATSKVETRAFTGSIKFDSASGGATGTAGTGKGMAIDLSFSGALDTTDDARPKMRMKMGAGGQQTEIVAPGDGKVYLTAEGRSYSIAIPPARTKQSTVDPSKIYSALGSAVSGFRPSQPVSNAAGQEVRTVSASVSKKQLCGPVLDAFGDALASSSGIGSQLGAGGSGKSGAEMLKGFCKSMLKSDPRVWLGIDRGKVTDVVLSAKLTLPMVGPTKLDAIYHEYNQGAPQTGFTPPANATPISAPTQLPAA